jgi:pyrroline-5-carboxylate reductase
MQEKVAVIGFGTMGQAVGGALVETGAYPPECVTAVAKGQSGSRRDRAAALGIGWVKDASDAARAADVVLLAVKPKELGALLDTLRAKGALDHHPLVISIAAGTKLAFLEERVPEGTPVVRAMPNTPCSIRKGMTVLVQGASAQASHMEVARKVFEPLGRVLEMEERYMDAVTSLSASGPAFVFIILEALAEGGVQCGLPRAVALELAAQMTMGSASMVLETGKHPAALKDEVTTPAGCTIAGLLTLEDGGLRSVVARAVEKAAQVAAGLG